MKVLVVSHENWNNNTNGGNVLSNIFSGLNFEFAQIYCSAGLPNNDLCKKYYQITDKMIIDNVLKGKQIGKEFTEAKENQDDLIFENNSKKKRWEVIFMLREIFWRLAKIDNDNFVKFIKDFNPDIIFAPCYGNIRMLRLTEIIAKYCDAAIVSYVSDDLYSYKVINYNPLYWIRRWNLRRHVRKTAKLYQLIYTMTEEQLVEYEKELKVPMKILRKACIYQGLNSFKKPYRIIYAGNLYLNRVDVLIKLAEAMKKYNEKEVNFVLDIYSGYSLNNMQSKLLDNRKDTFFHGLISSEKLKEEYNKCAVALHVESFEKKNALITRLSFSTKITDCLQSGAAMMAICPDINAGFKYLQANDCAICIDDVNNIDLYLKKIIENDHLLIEYAKKAEDVIKNNHDKCKNNEMILNDFNKFINNKV